jgi:hypothetical protein
MLNFFTDRRVALVTTFDIVFKEGEEEKVVLLPFGVGWGGLGLLVFLERFSMVVVGGH